MAFRMREDDGRRLHHGVGQEFVALALAAALVPALSGCLQTPSQAPSQGAPEDAAATDDAKSNDAGGRDSWSAACLDRHDELTVYAVTTLRGKQIEQLLKQNSYNWNTRNQCWFKDKGTSALAVYGPDGQILNDEEIAELAPGMSEGAATYRIVSSHYSSVKRAFDGLVSGGMTCEDVELTDQSGVAVVADTAGQRGIVFLHREEDAITVSFASQEAVSEGLFDTIAGQELGSSVDDVFEALAGRKPGDDAS